MIRNQCHDNLETFLLGFYFFTIHFNCLIGIVYIQNVYSIAFSFTYDLIIACSTAGSCCGVGRAGYAFEA